MTDAVLGDSTGESADCVRRALTAVGLDPVQHGLDAAIRYYQAVHAPPVDGQAGQITVAALGLEWSPPTSPRTGSRLIVPSLTFDRSITVAPWSQASIDAGNVVAYNGCMPGEGCTVWLAGHRSTHEAVFHAMHNLGPGSRVQVVHDGDTYDYTVQDIVVVALEGGTNAIYGDLVIQTSRSSTEAFIIHASLS